MILQSLLKAKQRLQMLIKSYTNNNWAKQGSARGAKAAQRRCKGSTTALQRLQKGLQRLHKGRARAAAFLVREKEDARENGVCGHRQQAKQTRPAKDYYLFLCIVGRNSFGKWHFSMLLIILHTHILRVHFILLYLIFLSSPQVSTRVGA